MSKQLPKREPTVAEMELMLKEQAATMPTSSHNLYSSKRSDLRRKRRGNLRIIKGGRKGKHLS